MTYCVGMMLDKGLVLMSDTRTNSGVDNISVFRKMHTWQVPGERIITIMTAGNLATTQAVVSQIDERNKAPGERRPSILEEPTMFQVATHVGNLLRGVIEGRQSGPVQGEGARFTATMIVAGQIRDMEPRLFMVYPEGNFIEASFDTPFFQIGETKYGRPILLRGYDKAMEFEQAGIAMAPSSSEEKVGGGGSLKQPHPSLTPHPAPSPPTAGARPRRRGGRRVCPSSSCGESRRCAD